MKKIILTIASLCAFSYAQASRGEVTSYDSTTGKYTVGKEKVKKTQDPINTILKSTKISQISR